MIIPAGVDTSLVPDTVLVLTDSAQRYNPVLRSLRRHATRAGVALLEVDPTASQRPLAGDRITAVAAVGPHANTAAQYAIHHNVVHLELDESGDAGHLATALRSAPNRSTVITVDLGDETIYAIDRVDIECDDLIDIDVDRHQWFDITGPVSFRNTTSSQGDVWITIHDCLMAVLSASPQLSSSIQVTPHGRAAVRIDERPFDAQQRKLTVSFTRRRRSIRFGVRTRHPVS